MWLNPSLANVPILYPENQNFSDIFREYKIKTLAENKLSISNAGIL